MPNGNTHKAVGGIAGAFGSIQLANQVKDPFQSLLILIGGSTGGYVGGMLPDKFDPPTCPNHRSTAHGLLPAGFGFAVLPDRIRQMAHAFLQWAEQAKRSAMAAQDWLQGLLYYLGQFACFFAAGFITGAFWGYISHLVLDFTTPRSLPLC